MNDAFGDEPRRIDPNALRYSQAQMEGALFSHGTGMFVFGMIVGIIVCAVWVSLR